METALLRTKSLILISILVMPTLKGGLMDMKTTEERMTHCPRHQSEIQSQIIGQMILGSDNRLLVGTIAQ
jgi:hypothetical protein